MNFLQQYIIIKIINIMENLQLNFSYHKRKMKQNISKRNREVLKRTGMF